MTFPKHKIITSGQLAQVLERSPGSERFCFILGSGASVESGIPSGNELEMQWMEAIMGDKVRLTDFENSAKYLYENKKIKHSFDEIKREWEKAKQDKKYLSSEYYFDLYKLYFYPYPRNGYHFLENLIERAEPSIGYHAMAKLLTRENTQNNLVITTNFDSLVEDSLFLYTDKKPLVVSHESLAQYADINVQRPVVAKIHRGLLYEPLNSTEEIAELRSEWRKSLSYAFSTYTPIVIGYGGGDQSLMAFMKEDTTQMRNGIFWCYRKQSGLPDKPILEFVEEKEGYLVAIDGFDELMLNIGGNLFKEEITPTGAENRLKSRFDRRVQLYNEQYNKAKENAQLQEILRPIEDAQQTGEAQREEEKKLTVWDYIRRGQRFAAEGKHQNAITEYSAAITLEPEFVIGYTHRGASYMSLENYDKAIANFSRAIQLDKSCGDVYMARGDAYVKVNMWQKAIQDYTDVIQIDEKRKDAYEHRADAYRSIGETELARQDDRTAETL